jgi:hypothetical protein
VHYILTCAYLTIGLAVGRIAVVEWHNGLNAGRRIVVMIALWHQISVLFVLCYRQGTPLVIHPLRLEA